MAKYKAASYSVSKVFLTMKQEFIVAKGTKIVEGVHGTKQEFCFLSAEM